MEIEIIKSYQNKCIKKAGLCNRKIYINWLGVFTLVIFNNIIIYAQTWSLQQCVDTALLYNYNIGQNRINIQLAQQKWIEAKEKLIPQVQINTGYRYFIDLPYQFLPLSTFNPATPPGQFREAQLGVPHNINSDLQISIPLYNPILNGALMNSEIGKDIALLIAEKDKDQMIYDISKLYYALMIISKNLVFLDSTLANTEKLVLQVTSLMNQNMVTGDDVFKVKWQVSKLIYQKNGLILKKNQFMSLLKYNLGISQDIIIEIDTAVAALYNYSEIKQEEIAELKINKGSRKIIVNDISNLKAVRYTPNLNVSGSYGLYGFGYDKNPGSFLKFYPSGWVGLQLSYNLTNSYQNKIKIKQKKLELESNVIQYKKISEQNIVWIQQYQKQLTYNISHLSLLSEQIIFTQTLLNKSFFRFNQGLGSVSDIVNAQNSLNDAHIQYLNAVLDYTNTYLDLKKVLGNLKNN